MEKRYAKRKKKTVIVWRRAQPVWKHPKQMLRNLRIISRNFKKQFCVAKFQGIPDILRKHLSSAAGLRRNCKSSIAFALVK